MLIGDQGSTNDYYRLIEKETTTDLGNRIYNLRALGSSLMSFDCVFTLYNFDICLMSPHMR